MTIASCLVGIALCAASVRHKLFGTLAVPDFRQQAVRRIEHFKSQGIPPEVICIGSSHVFCGVDPRLLGERALNVAESALNYEIAECLVERHWATIGSAKVVLLELDRPGLFADTLGKRNGDYSNLWNWGLEPDDLPFAGFQLLASRLDYVRLGTRVQLPWHPPVPADVSIHGPGYWPHPWTPSRVLTALEVNQFRRGDGYIRDNAQLTTNIAAGRRVIQALRGHGCKVVLVRPPRHREILEEHCDLDLSLDRFARESGTPVWDDRSLFSNDEYFWDATHLSAEGSVAWTRILANRIQTLETE